MLGASADAEAIEEAAACLMRGELVILPTDTLYALACRASDADAARRVREAKGRDDRKPLPLVAGDADQARALARFTPMADVLAAAFWPGPLTLVLPAAPGLPEPVSSGAPSVAVRVPAHDTLRAICLRVGALVSTSANRSGEEAPRTCDEAVAAVGSAAALALDGGPGRGAASTLVDAGGDAPRLVRAGAVPFDDVLRALRR